MSSSNASHVEPDWPDLDDRLVEAGTRYEMLDGELVYVPPADEPHGERHSRIAALVEAHAAADFKVACDMLTRTSKVDDIAPDVSVYPRARHPETGRRQLDHLSFEVVSTESLSHAGHKAAKLATRGVRRVFAIDVDRERVLEWSHALATWSVLDTGAQIVDPTLAAPLPISALLDAGTADDAIARALIAKRNPQIENARTASKQDGFVEGLAVGRVDALLRLLGARDIALANDDRVRILRERDPATLGRWIERAASCTDVAQLFEPA